MSNPTRVNQDPTAKAVQGRIVSVDVARFFALLGIIGNHIFGNHLVSRAMWDFHAIAFVLLVGVGLALGIPSQAEPGKRWLLVRQAWLRAAVLLAVGLSLHDLQNSVVNVVLVHLAVIMAIAAVICLLPLRWIAVSGAALLFGGGWAVWAVRSRTPELMGKDVGWMHLGEPLQSLNFVLFAPYYQVALWVAVAVAGVLVGRMVNFRSARSMMFLTASGTALAAISWVVSALILQRIGTPQTYSLLERAAGEFPNFGTDPRFLAAVGAYLPSVPSALFSTGVALALLGLVCLVCLPKQVANNWAVRAMADVGAMTLTAYTAHVLILSLIKWGADQYQLSNLIIWNLKIAHVVVLLAALWAWHRWIPGRLSKGPLEWLSRWVAGLVRQPAS